MKLDLSDLHALTLYPEWVYAILHFGKDIENRVWRPPTSSMRRWIAIHGGVAPGGIPARQEHYTDAHAEAVREMLAMARANGHPLLEIVMRDIMKCRGIVALAYLDEVREPVKYRTGWQVPDQENSKGKILPCYGWHFSRILRLEEPVPLRGSLGLWRVPLQPLRIISDAVAKL